MTTKLLLVIKNPNQDLELAKNYIEDKNHDDFFIKNSLLYFNVCRENQLDKTDG